MELTGEELRSRGIRRDLGEVEDEARRLTLYTLGSLPTGRWVGEPLREFSAAEAQALERGGMNLSVVEAGEPDVLARTAARHAAMLATALTTSEAADLLAVGESRVRQRLAEGSLYSVRVGREHRLPAFQFESGKEVPGIARVLECVERSVHPVALLNWFTMPDPDLRFEGEKGSVSPRQWLLSGGLPEPLIALAGEL